MPAFKRPGVSNPQTGEAGKWERISGRDIFMPSGDASPEQIGADAMERLSRPGAIQAGKTGEYDEDKHAKTDKEPSEAENGTNKFTVDYIENRGVHGRAVDGETYIGEPVKEDDDKVDTERANKITEIGLNDLIVYYDNGVKLKGKVIGMSGQMTTVLKEDGVLQDYPSDGIFFVTDILNNKPWDAMDYTEKTAILLKAGIPANYYLTRPWELIDKYVQNAIKSATQAEEDTNLGSSFTEQNIRHDAPEGYEESSVSAPSIEQFAYEEKKPNPGDEEVPRANESPEIEKISYSRNQIAGVSDSRKVDEEDEKEKVDQNLVPFGKVEQNLTPFGKEDGGDDAKREVDDRMKSLLSNIDNIKDEAGNGLTDTSVYVNKQETTVQPLGIAGTGEFPTLENETKYSDIDKFHQQGYNQDSPTNPTTDEVESRRPNQEIREHTYQDKDGGTGDGGVVTTGTDGVRNERHDGKVKPEHQLPSDSDLSPQRHKEAPMDGQAVDNDKDNGMGSANVAKQNIGVGELTEAQAKKWLEKNKEKQESKEWDL